MTIGIVGSRNTGEISMDLFSGYIPENCTAIVSGGAAGVDSYAEIYAKQKGIAFIKILPDYNIFGKNAPIIRNTTIVKKAESVIAFWDYKSRGTAHAIKECIRLAVPIKIIALKDIEV